MLAATPELVADIAQRPSISDVAEIGGDSFFLAGDDHLGRALWKTDGTLAGTELISEIDPTHNSADLSGLKSIDGALYFVGSGGLWRSDGTTAGTHPLTDGPFVYGQPMDLAGGIGFLASFRGVWGWWGSDGTAENTQVLEEIPLDSSSGENATYQGILFFENDGELWRTDGTLAGTFRLRDATGGVIDEVHATPSGVLFGDGTQWWRSDGTTEGTEPVPGFPSFDGRISEWHSFGTDVVYKTTRFGQPTALWKSNGTAEGTQLLGDVEATSNGLPFDGGEITLAGDFAYFIGSDAEHGKELWRTDGTVEGTGRVADLFPGPVGSNPDSLTSVGDTLFFVANDGVSGEELWRVDPDSNEPALVLDLLAGADSSIPLDLVAVNNQLYFTADDGEGRFLWQSDGTADGTRQVIESQRLDSARTIFINDSGANRVFFSAAAPPSLPQLWVADVATGNAEPVLTWNSRSEPALSFSAAPADKILDDGFVFFANDGIHGLEPWFSDGTRQGTHLVKDIFPGRLGSADALDEIESIVLNGVLYFAADDGRNGKELWRSDGTNAGTYLVHDVAQGHASADPRPIAVFDGNLLFNADDGVHGRELWLSNPAAESTRMLADIDPTGDGVITRELIAIAGGFLFFADDGSTGPELWKSDGTAEGTELVADIAPGIDGSFPVRFIAHGDTVLFSADDRTHGREVWRMSGIDGNPERLLSASGRSLRPGSFVLFQDQVFFDATDDVGLRGLWRSDGTQAGTQLVHQFNVSGASNLTPADDKLFFVSSETGRSRLWVSDGTDAGTRVIIPPNDNRLFGLSSPTNLRGIGSKAFFTTHQEGELWRSDGSDAGSFPTEVAPGLFFRASPHGMTEHNGFLFFSASHPESDREMWRLPIRAAEVVLPSSLAAVYLFAENDEFVVRANGVVLLRMARDSISYLDFRGGDANFEFVVDFAGGDAIPPGGIVFTGECCLPTSIELTNGQARSVAYDIREEVTEITVDERTIRLEGWLHRNVADNLNADTRLIRSDSAVTNWQMTDILDGLRTELRQAPMSDSSTVLRIRADSPELTLALRGGSTLVASEAELSRPERTIVSFPLNDPTPVAVNPGEGFTQIHRGTLDGRIVFHRSNRRQEIVSFAEGNVWRNPVNGHDVNGSGEVSALDALVVINDLNVNDARHLGMPRADDPHRFLDVNDDRHVSPLDALLVINRLNSPDGLGEEAEGSTIGGLLTASPAANATRAARNENGTSTARVKDPPESSTIPSTRSDAETFSAVRRILERPLRWEANDFDPLIELLAADRLLSRLGQLP